MSEVKMDSDSDFEEFPSSQISFCGYDGMFSQEYGGDVIDSDKENDNIVSLENNSQPVNEPKSSGVCNGRQWILYDNVMIEDISSDEEIDKM